MASTVDTENLYPDHTGSPFVVRVRCAFSTVFNRIEETSSRSASIPFYSNRFPTFQNSFERMAYTAKVGQ